MVYLFLANGFEIVEAMTPIDLLRRAGIEVKTVSIGSKLVHCSRGVGVEADLTMDEIEPSSADMIILPGGMPGTKNLFADQRVCQIVLDAVQQQRYIAAICAAPSIILGGLGVLQGKKATCYPGMEDGMTGATALSQNCVVDGPIITGRGAGAAMDFSLALVSALSSPEKAAEIAASIAYVG